MNPLSGFMIEWCSICNKRPSEGTLTILIEDVQEDVPACSKCVSDPDQVEFV